MRFLLLPRGDVVPAMDGIRDSIPFPYKAMILCMVLGFVDEASFEMSRCVRNDGGLRRSSARFAPRLGINSQPPTIERYDEC